VPQSDRACEQVARCWADAWLYEIAANGTLSMVTRMVRKIKCAIGLSSQKGRESDKPLQRSAPADNAEGRKLYLNIVSRPADLAIAGEADRDCHLRLCV